MTTSSSARPGFATGPASWATIFDQARLQARVGDLEQAMQAPGFWDDQTAAARIAAAHSAQSGRLAHYRELTAEVDELSELAALAREEERSGKLDPGFLTELDEGLGHAEVHVARLEEVRLFQGEHDEGDAVVSIHAGEGGTDAQDWTEMLLRMYLRWAERRGLRAEIKEASEGTEAGLKSVTFILSGQNAYGLA